MGRIAPGGDKLYAALEELLKKAGKEKQPVTSVELFDDPRVKKSSENDLNRVSDVLGHLFRRGVIERRPAPKTVNSQARWAYYWDPDQAKPATIPGAKTLLHRPTIEVTEEGNNVRILLPHLEITIKVRG